MEKKKRNRFLKYVLKTLLSVAALYLVFRKVDIVEVKKAILSVQIIWLVPAFIFFNISKIISAYRLNRFFRQVDCFISEKYNLQLYYIGMFYNLFLPGGIGGDGYKIFILKKQKQGNVKDLVAATLIDRVSGLAALLVLAILLFLFSSVKASLQGYSFLLWVGMLMVFPAFYAGLKIFFKAFVKIFYITNIQALGVQLSQLICAFFIMKALGINGHYLDYLTLFLISSVVAIIPFTIGGLGARELVFGYGNSIMLVDPGLSVSIGTLFFLITALSSLIGAFLNSEQKKH